MTECLRLVDDAAGIVLETVAIIEGSNTHPGIGKLLLQTLKLILRRILVKHLTEHEIEELERDIVVEIDRIHDAVSNGDVNSSIADTMVKALNARLAEIQSEREVRNIEIHSCVPYVSNNEG